MQGSSLQMPYTSKALGTRILMNQEQICLISSYLLNGRSVKALFMTSWKRQFVLALDGFKVLKLPYKQGGDHIRRYSDPCMCFFQMPEMGCQLWLRELVQSGFLDRYLPSETVAVDKF